MVKIVKEIEREAAHEARRQIATNLLRDGIPVAKTAKLAQLTEQEVEELRKQLQ